MSRTLIPVRMREAREAARLTREKLGAKSGVSPSLIGQIESGRFIPYDSQLNRIAEALGVENPDELLEPLGVK